MAKKSRHSGRFREGSIGGCEALLYEFQDWPIPDLSNASQAGKGPLPVGAGHILIAATKFEEAVLHLQKSRPDFRVRSVRCFGLIELCSGSPLN